MAASPWTARSIRFHVLLVAGLVGMSVLAAGLARHMAANATLSVFVVSAERAAEMERAARADVTSDGRVDVLDIAAWSFARKRVTAGMSPDPRADLTGDGVIDAEDLAEVLRAFGERIPA